MTFITTKEDLEQNTTGIPVLMQRQVLVIQKAPQEQHEDCMTKYNEIQMEKKLRSA